MLVSLEQDPPGLGQPGLPAAPPQLVDLRSPHLVDRVAHVLRDVEAVEDMERLARFLRDDRQVGSPDVAADKPEGRGAVASEPAEEPEQRLHPALLADPEQPLPSRIDLIDQRQVPLPALPLDLIDPDRLDIGLAVAAEDKRARGSR
jgi:hypothetical protein